ncbi:MAG: hypothetical protein M1840_007496 [Geoglossum simile]|nr:MAG: hypothetical protein M1840_007496 [Geoglossum simile]
MREGAQVEEEAIEEDIFDISDAEKQLLLDQTRHIESRTSPIPDSSHSAPEPQYSNRDPTNNFLDQSQQQRDELHEAHANKRAVKGYGKCHTITIFKERDHVSIAVPAHDRGPTDSKCIFGKILNVDESKPDCYQVITVYGVLDRLFPVKDLLPLPATIPLDIPSKRMKRITLAYAACQESTSSATPVTCSCKRGCTSSRCQCKKYKQKCSIACHEEGIDCGNLSSLATRTEKSIVQHRTKCRRANTKGLSVHWQEDEHSVEGEDAEEDELAERELARLVASGGASEPLWTKELDLVGMTRAGKTFVQSEMRLRNRQLNSQQQQNKDEK